MRNAIYACKFVKNIISHLMFSVVLGFKVDHEKSTLNRFSFNKKKQRLNLSQLHLKDNLEGQI